MVPGAYRAGRIKRLRPGEELCNNVLVLLTEKHALLCQRCAYLHNSQWVHPNSDRVRLNVRSRMQVPLLRALLPGGRYETKRQS